MNPFGGLDERSPHFPTADVGIRHPRSPRANRTLASDLAEQLRSDILHCRLKPNARLLFRDLRATYGSGMSPLREALMRLASEGLVVLEDHKGFRVAPVSRNELTDIAETRCELEALAVRLAIERGDDAWRRTIEARFAALSETPTYTREGRLDPEWELRHDAFHRSLYAACGLRWLTSFCQVLAERAFRYRHLLLEAVDRTRDHRQEHDEIKQAVVRGDAPVAIALLQRHYMETVRTLISNCEELT
jgi:DNA-binding GntR family transcriptional regulator